MSARVEIDQQISSVTEIEADAPSRIVEIETDDVRLIEVFSGPQPIIEIQALQSAGTVEIPASHGPQGPQGGQGQEGLSAYQVWLSQGNSGTVQDFLESIKGTVEWASTNW